MTDIPDVPATDAVERRVLVVDDDRTILEPIRRFLKSRGFEVETANTSTAALEHLRASRFATMICDVRMPGTSGIDLVPAALKIDPDVAVLMLTGLNDASAATDALTHGAADYLLKPIELGRLEDAINRALQRRREHADLRGAQRALRDGTLVRASEFEQHQRDVTRVTLDVLDAIVTELEAKSPHRSGHSARVAELSVAIANALGLDQVTTGNIHIAARLHDLGNIAVPEFILLKTTPLAAGEHADVRRHVHVTLQILAPVAALEPVLPFIAHHHERWAGGGYPADLKGDTISIGGRILAAADAYVAVTAGRPYFSALAPAAALAHLAPHAGSHFDPPVFRALQQIVRDRIA